MFTLHASLNKEQMTMKGQVLIRTDGFPTTIRHLKGSCCVECVLWTGRRFTTHVHAIMCELEFLFFCGTSAQYE